jgi:hypothetical protein
MICCPGSVDVKATCSPVRTCPPESRTVAVPVELAVPSAAIVVGSRLNSICAGGPAVCLRVARSSTAGLTLVSVAVNTDDPICFVAVVVAR